MSIIHCQKCAHPIDTDLDDHEEPECMDCRGMDNAPELFERHMEPMWFEQFENFFADHPINSKEVTEHLEMMKGEYQ